MAITEVRPAPFGRFAGLCAIAAGVCAFLYAVSFVVISRSAPALGVLLSALFLMLVGLLATIAWWERADHTV